MINPEKTTLNLGFVPLTDSAPLIIAKELGFFEQWGLDVQLRKQNSWATLRDKLHAGVLDAAQMLAPMPIASTLGLGVKPHHIVTPLILSLNGNAITLSEQLYQTLLQTTPSLQNSWPLNANSLNAEVVKRAADSRRKLTFATVFPYSCHHYQLNDWLAAGGLTPQDVDIVIVPPINMVDALHTGRIDGFCVGGPWNAKAVRLGAGATVLTSFDIWLDSPEKVLGLSGAFVQAHPQTVIALCAGLKQACDWLDSVPNRFEAAILMGQQHYLNQELEVIAPSLIGSCLTHRSSSPRSIPSYNRFSTLNGKSVNQPQKSHGEWLINKMIHAGQVPLEITASDIVSRVFREDIYLTMVEAFKLRPETN